MVTMSAPSEAVDDAVHQLARRMLESRYPDAHFNVSFLDFFVQGVDEGGGLFLDRRLAESVADANARLARWDDPTGFDAPELPYIHSYGQFLLDEHLAELDYEGWVEDADRGKLAPLTAPLTAAGTELVADLTRLSPGLLDESDVPARARHVLALRKHCFRPEIERAEREAVIRCREGDFGAALGWAYPALRLDPDNGALRTVVTTAREADPRLPSVEVGEWLPAVEAVEGWLSRPEAEALARCVAAAPGDRAPDMVEIGSYKGRSTLAISLAISALKLPLRLIAVDPHEGYRYGDGTDTYSELRSNLTRNGVDSVVSILRSRGDEAPVSGPLSFALIDGLHDEESVRADHEHIAPLLVPGGLLAFHDYFEHYPGIVRLVDELMQSGEFRFIECADRLVVLERA
jgi:predicted O-methyltransferase YrrM